MQFHVDLKEVFLQGKNLRIRIHVLLKITHVEFSSVFPINDLVMGIMELRADD